jgi:Cu-Zn family superoxide dismutase
MNAVAQLRGRGIRGTVLFEQRGKFAHVYCSITGVPDGAHGLHVHQYGDQRQGCESMGEHYSRRRQAHGGRHTRVRHTGDLGNVSSTNGVVEQTFEVPLQVADILGRGLVLHADRDDLGRGGWADSSTTGHSGARIACGVVALAASKQN